MKFTFPVQRGYFRREKFRRRFYRRTLSLFLLITCIPGVVTGLGIYFLTKVKMEGALTHLDRRQTLQQVSNINTQLDDLEQLLAHFAFDPTFDNSLQHLSFAYSFEQVRALYSLLYQIQVSNPLIGSVHLYLQDPQPVVITANGYTFLDSTAAATYNKLLNQRHSVYWSYNIPPESDVTTPQSSTALVNEIPGGSIHPFGVLIATVNPQQLADLVQAITPSGDGSAFLLGPSNQFLVTSNGSPSKLDTALRTALPTLNATSGSDIFQLGNTAYSVTTGSFARLDGTWRYVSATPLTVITAPLLLLSKLILLISLFMFLVALVISWTASGRIYSPIERLLRQLLGGNVFGQLAQTNDEFELIENQWNQLTRETQNLRQRLEEQLPLLLDSFTMQLVQGALFHLKEEEICERFVTYGVNPYRKKFFAVVVQIATSIDEDYALSHRNRELDLFALSNGLYDIWSNREGISFIPLNFHDDSVGLLALVPSDWSSDHAKSEVFTLSREYTQKTEPLNLSFAMTISKSAASVTEIPYLFEDARKGFRYRKLDEPHQIIDLDLLGDPYVHEFGFSYPFSLEKQLIHAIRMRDYDEASAHLKSFIQTLSQPGYTEQVVRQGMLHLLGGIQHTILELGMDPLSLYHGVNLYDVLSQQVALDDILHWFTGNVIVPIMNELVQQQTSHSKQVIEEVLAYLHEHYLEDLSMENIADQFGMSAFTLSRNFKQVVGENFIDYLTHMRLQQAKTLLRNTDMKIQEIAECVGYRHSYFHRIFKRHFGFTPGQFREQRQQSD